MLLGKILIVVNIQILYDQLGHLVTLTHTHVAFAYVWSKVHTAPTRAAVDLQLEVVFVPRASLCSDFKQQPKVDSLEKIT